MWGKAFQFPVVKSIFSWSCLEKPAIDKYISKSSTYYVLNNVSNIKAIGYDLWYFAGSKFSMSLVYKKTNFAWFDK